jgi:hypothetical protein
LLAAIAAAFHAKHPVPPAPGAAPSNLDAVHIDNAQRGLTAAAAFRAQVSRIALSDGAESTIFDGLPASASGVL